MSIVKLLVVDDHDFFRRSLMLPLEMEERIEIVGTATSGDQAITLVRSLRPDVVLMTAEHILARAPQATQRASQPWLLRAQVPLGGKRVPQAGPRAGEAAAEGAADPSRLTDKIRA